MNRSFQTANKLETFFSALIKGYWMYTAEAVIVNTNDNRYTRSSSSPWTVSFMSICLDTEILVLYLALQMLYWLYSRQLSKCCFSESS